MKTDGRVRRARDDGAERGEIDLAALEARLRERVRGEVRFDAGSRGAYSTDGSNYRQVPIGVVVPYDVEAGAEAVAVCAEFGAPLLSRGGGTSLGGQGTNAAVVLDWTKYCHGLVCVDAEARTCVVEPGIVLDELNRQLSGHRLMFGPKPSTHSHCSLGGMIGNNSCGGSAQTYGKTVDNVRRLEILTYDGMRCWVGPTSETELVEIVAGGGRKAAVYQGLRELASRYLGDIRRGFPRIPRRVSGYNLDSLLPENGFDLARALVGSEGTLVTVLRAELDLVPVPPYEALVVLGYEDICAAADEVPKILQHSAPEQLEALVGAFGEVKALFDPWARMNPGKLVAPARVDQHLRLGASWRPEGHETHFGYPDDEGSFTRAVTRCVGIGNCRSHSGGVMCPSYRATGEEEHSTRGRARLLFELLNGHADSVVTDGWRSTEVRDALDLCLACKGCKSDCPVGVDMATYKAEFLSHHYAGRLRPVAHYSLGWLPLWARLSRSAPRAVNALLHAPGLARAGKALAGVARERDAPVFTRQSFLQWWTARRAPEPDPADPRTVVLWPDTFNTYFHPSVAKSAVRVLEDAGFQVAVPTRAVCCGLTWISTGQLDTAKRVLRRTVEVLRPWIEAGTPVVGLEPSCTAVFRSDAPELLPENEDVQRLSGQFRTFSELLLNEAPDDWRPPSLTRAATVQTHCHQHAVMRYDADRELMRRAGIDADVLDAGCCGLAGNFGFEREHHEVSMAVGEQGVLPAVREAPPGAVVLADGFSCRTQIEQGGTGRRALHLAEALALGLDGTLPADHPEKLAERPASSPRAARLATAAVLGTGITVAAALASVLRRRI
ncbi:FAD-binding protein [Streptomyces sp. NBC_01186]|uniref:FAD-binding and (Fe-S)-binding domain-containing protein n=1 Tax=Streptomyces sp. NBC_01186 TaxID=2903765 RepID=UPI002E0F87C6|nr:FAD-binding protein [Streptomyces sp. NBC_01186]